MYLKFKNILKVIHLWIGLFSGIIVLIICTTGCVYTFQHEIKLAFFPHYSVENTHADKLDFSTLLASYKSQSSNKVLSIYDFTNPNRTTIIRTSKDSQLYDSFLDPYSGVLLKEKSHSKYFFRVVLSIHRNLLLRKEIGRKIVGYTVVIFILSLLTGIVLWFPKNIKVFKSKKGRKSKFTVKKTKNKKRLIYDLHSVLGLYGSFILIIIAVTGLGWTFSWVDDSLYRMVTFEKKEKTEPVIINSTVLSYKTLDTAKKAMDYNQKDRNLFLYILPKKVTSPLKISSYPNDDSYGSSDHFYFHPKTGIVIKTDLDVNKKRGTKFRSLYYDIHTGSLLGLWGKILVFLAGLIGTSLPITGFMMWRNAKRKNANSILNKV